MSKTQSNFRLTDIARALLEKIARSLGLTPSGTLEVLIREAAKTKGIK
jgi:antitoxin component of RelBE/YafQ-DinJ toxin-antitoxin module